MTKISIAVRDPSPVKEFIYSMLVLSFTAGGAWFWLAHHDVEMTMKFGLSALLFLLLATVSSKISPLILINKNGVYDRRLGVGQIPWKDIIGVQVAGGYGQRVLCLRVKASERYVNRLWGSKRKRARERQELGFKQFVIDLAGVDLNLLDLKQLIERRIAG